MRKEEAEMFDDVIRDAARQFLTVIGSRGGKKTAERGPDYYREIQKRSVEVRRKNKLDK